MASVYPAHVDAVQVNESRASSAFGGIKGDTKCFSPTFLSFRLIIFPLPFFSTFFFIHTGWRVFFEELLPDSSTEAGASAPVLHGIEFHGAVGWDCNRIGNRDGGTVS